MKGITYVSRMQLQAALRNHDELMNKNPLWKEEIKRFEELYKQEKLRRNNIITQEKTVDQTSISEEN